MARASEVEEEALKRTYYQDILAWLERIKTIAPSGFVNYRLGRIHLLLGNRSEAQQAFAAAVDMLPADSIYREPAVKLARELLQ